MDPAKSASWSCRVIPPMLNEIARGSMAARFLFSDFQAG
jgi:hypothetical protein